VLTHSFQYRYRKPRNTPEERGGKPPAYRRILENRHAMIIERDVVIPMRDGVKLYADIFRPPDERPVPPIIAWTPYGKHVPFDPRRFLNAGVKEGDTSEYTAFEAPDPVFWVPSGYAVIVIDVRGTWYSEGTAHYLAPEEAQDFYDAVEWAGMRPWSNGKVGLSGVSYLAQLQWRVAELNPPHLAAINPWEGWTDSYREVATHGGIPDTHFWPTLWNRWGAAKGQIEDLEAETKEHPLYDDFWRSKAVDFSKIKAPAFVVASWTDQGLHTRGTFEGFKHIASKQKYLLAHGQKKWAHYYVPENMQRLRHFFDHVLKGVDNDVKNWPKVLIEVRERNGVAKVRAENEWPLARTHYTKLYLNAARGRLESAPVAQTASVSYGAVVAELAEAERATFIITFDRDTELTGSFGSLCRAPRATTWTSSLAYTSSMPPVQLCRLPITRSSMTDRWRSAGCAPRTANLIRKNPPTGSRSIPTRGCRKSHPMTSCRSTSKSGRRAQASNQANRCS
jgi:uncharacterized protein